jgi:hypothetical protein
VGESGAMEWSAGVVELARVAATSPVAANYPSRRLVRRNLAIGPELRVWLYRKAQSPSLRNCPDDSNQEQMLFA